MPYYQQEYVKQAQALRRLGELRYLDIKARARELAARLRQDGTMSASMSVGGVRVLVTATQGYEVI